MRVKQTQLVALKGMVINMQKKLFAILALLTCLFMLISCISTIEDTNGEADKTLASITDEALKKINGRIVTTNSKKIGSPSVQRYENAGGFSDEEYDYDKIEFTFSKLSGTVKTMITYLKKGERLTIDFSCKIKKGNFASVILSPDRSEIIIRFEADDEKIFEFTAKEDGDYLLLIAGESCDGSISVLRSFN